MSDENLLKARAARLGARSLGLGGRLCGFVTLALVAFSACGPKTGRTKPGLRVVSLVPSVTEIIYAVGAQEYLHGNTTFCDYPESARHVYKVGDFVSPDFERIVGLKPDLVFLTLPAQQQIAEKLKEAGIRYYVSRPGTVDAILAEIDSVAGLLGRKDSGRLLAESMRKVLDGLPAYSDTPKVYVEISGAPLMSVGPGAFITSILEKAGGRNIYSRAGVQEYPLVDPEYVVKAAPDVILLLYPGNKAGELTSRLGWADIPAVKSGRVFDNLDPNLYCRPGPRAAQAVVELARILHPMKK